MQKIKVIFTRLVEDTEWLKNYNKAMQNKLGGHHPRLDRMKDEDYKLMHLSDLDEKAQLNAIKINPSAIRFIKNPSENVQLHAVYYGNKEENELDRQVIKYIKEPTEKVQLLAIDADPNMIRFISNPTEAVQYKIIEKDPMFVFKLNNPSHRILYFACEQFAKQLRSAD